jgi:tetratricopeptide (TPR) repeat protein
MNIQNWTKTARLCLLFFFLFCPTLYSDTTVDPRLEPTEFIKSLVQTETPLSLETMITASLVFSDTMKEEIGEYGAIINTLCHDFLIKAKEYGTEKAIAENALLYLHEHILHTYDEYQTSIHTVLRSGVYNCVSSAVLYMILCHSLSIDVWGVKTKDHAFCRVSVEGNEYDVETTTRYGFEPGKKKEFFDAFGNSTGYSYVPPTHYSARQDISQLELLTLILQNRITSYTTKNMFAEAVGPGVDIYILLQDDTSFENMLKTFINMATWYDEKNRYEEGCVFFDRAIERYGEHKKLLEVRFQLANNYIIHLLDRFEFEAAASFIRSRFDNGHMREEELEEFTIIIALKRSENLSRTSYEQAIGVIDEAIAVCGKDNRLIRTKDGLINNWIVSLLEKSDFDTGETLINNMKAKGEIDERTWKKFMTVIYQERASILARKEGYLKAADYLTKAMEVVGSDNVLQENYEVYIYNYTVDIHNKVIELWNKGKYEEAGQLLEEGLKNAPSSSILTNDLVKLKKALGE